MEQEKNLDKKTKEEKRRELAKVYAKYLKKHNAAPGDEITPRKDKEKVVEQEESKPSKTTEVSKEKDTKKASPEKSFEERIDRFERLAVIPAYAFDKVQDRAGAAIETFGRNFAREFSSIIGTYKTARKTIAAACLVVCVLCSVMLIIFDRFTVYEYAYNGKSLGYVGSQDDVTNVLDIAGKELNEVNDVNENVSQKIEFIANDNISFKLVKAENKDLDDADTTLNKLAYMTEVEVVASAIYDGDNLVTIVKDDEDAEKLLAEVKTILGTPDKGMEKIFADFSKKLEIRPINVLLTSVQSKNAARKQMTQGGKAKFYHLAEPDETIQSIAEDFGVGEEKIYNSKSTEILKEVSPGEEVCIHKDIEPVSVKLIEKGKMKEIVPYETIEKKTKELFIGEEEIGVKGVKGTQIFEGTLTKIGGKVVDRDTKKLEVITKKVDQVVYIGTTKRPKDAPTGIFRNPMKPGTYIVTSRPGWRWGRTHEGVDMASSVGVHVFASDGGTVIRASYYSGYGYCIDIQHGDGWMTRYAHLSYIGVHNGQKVYQGQYIGNVGSTGNSTGPHLHFETRKNGAFVNPDSKVRGGL